MRRLTSYLDEVLQRELGGIKRAATRILDQPLDHDLTDHTIAHPERIEEHLDRLLCDWAEQQVAQDEPRARAELFILLAATYLHDIGMQLAHTKHCPSLLRESPLLAEGLREASIPTADAEGHVTGAMLDFARKHHHLITHDWLARANLRSGRDIFLPTGLHSYPDIVARVAWAHNTWLTDEASYERYESLLRPRQEQCGEIRPAVLAAFLRMGDILDMDRRRVDVDRLRRFPVPLKSKAHWWRHHFVRTFRLDDHGGPTGRPLHVVYSLPEEHTADEGQLREAIWSATVHEVDAEQRRLQRWLGAAGVRVDLRGPDACEMQVDASGAVHPMPDDVAIEFGRIWPRAAGEAARIEVQSALRDHSLDAGVLGAAIGPMTVRAEIQEYLEHVRLRTETGLTGTPYTAIEIDYGDFRDALDAVERLVELPNPGRHPLVIVGDPGGGKTTLLRRYVHDCARGERTPQYVPIFVQANRYGDDAFSRDIHARLGSALSPIADAEHERVMDELVERLLLLAAESLCELAEAPVKHAGQMLARLREVMARRTCLVVLDGLNEAPPDLRSLAIAAVRRFTREYPSHRVVVTSRVGDYHEDTFREAPVHRVLPLTEAAIRSYYKAIGIPGHRQDGVLGGRSPLADLVRNPMYMYMVGELLRAGQLEWVSQPGRLFRQFTEETIRRWHAGHAGAKLSPEGMLEAMSALAFAAMEQQEVSFGRVRVDAALGEDAGEKRGELLATGLLVRQSAERYAFRHHTTQDFLVAVALETRQDRLHELVPKPAFHEPIRLLVGLLDEPAPFIRRLLAATSDGFGRANMLPLAFRVAGAVPSGTLDDDTLRLLYAGATPLLHAAHTILQPFCVEVLQHLFGPLGKVERAGFFAYVAEREEHPADLRELARRQALAVLRDPSAAAFDPGIPEPLWSDYRRARKMVAELAGADAPLGRQPLLIGGLTATISLSMWERRRILRTFGRITQNQLGTLESIFVAEWLAFGAMMARGYEAELAGLARGCLSDVLLVEGDRHAIAGETAAAISSYLEMLPTLGAKVELFRRIIRLSGSASAAQWERIRTALESWSGEDLAWSYATDNRNTFVSRLGDSGEVHAGLHELLRDKRAGTPNAHMVLFLTDVLRRIGRHDALDAASFQSRLDGVVWGSRESLLLLTEGRRAGGPEVAGLCRQLLEEHHPDRPERRFRKLLELQIAGDPADLAARLAPFILRSAYGREELRLILDAVDEALGVEAADQLVEAVEAMDRELSAFGWIHRLPKLTTNEYDKCAQYMADHGLSLRRIKALGGGSAGASAVFQIGLVAPLQVRKEAASLLKKLEPVLAARLLEMDDKAGALALATSILGRAPSEDPTDFHNSSVQELAQFALRLASEQHADGADLPNDVGEGILRGLLRCCREPSNTEWALKGLERLRALAPSLTEAMCDGYADLLGTTGSLLSSTHRTTILGRLSKLGRHDDVRAILPEHVARCPGAPAGAADYLGCAAWYAYLADDADQLLSLTEQAIALAPEGYRRDWLLGNRALGHMLHGREADALRCYEAAPPEVASSERWQHIALDDLEHHHERIAGAAPIDPAFIDRVRELWTAPPPPPPETLEGPHPGRSDSDAEPCGSHEDLGPCGIDPAEASAAPPATAEPIE